MAFVWKPVGFQHHKFLRYKGNHLENCKKSFIGYSLDYHNKYRILCRRYKNGKFMG